MCIGIEQTDFIEEWKPLVYKDLDLSDRFLISNTGKLYSKISNKILKTQINKEGYEIVCVSLGSRNNKKILRMHVAVAYMFVDGYRDDFVVNHKDGNKLNNNFNNLERVTQQENMRHSIDVLGNNIGEKNWRAKAIKGINKKDKSELYFNAMSDGARYLSEINNVNFNYAKQSLWRALNGYLKSYKGYVWQYI